MELEIKWADRRKILRVDETENGVCLLRFPLLEETGVVEHCFSTRIGGVSEGFCSSMNLSFTRGDEEAAVRENFRRLAEGMGVSEGDFVFTDQTHTANVRKVTAADAGCGLVKPRNYTDVDGLITDVPGLVLSAFFADCVPLYFVDPAHRAIGLCHSGWRGTAGRIGRAVVEAMEREYASAPSQIICAIGPSICRDCYEVSRDVAEVFAAEFAGSPVCGAQEIVCRNGRGKYQLDLWKANEIVLLEAGILREHLAPANLCTCCNPKLLFSHRASHGKRGNLGAFLSLKA